MSVRGNTLEIPYEIEQALEILHPYVKVCYYELLSGKSLTTFNQRQHRSIKGNKWDKYVHTGLAVELFKQTKLMNTKGAY